MPIFYHYNFLANAYFGTKLEAEVGPSHKYVFALKSRK